MLQYCRCFSTVEADAEYPQLLRLWQVMQLTFFTCMLLATKLQSVSCSHCFILVETDAGTCVQRSNLVPGLDELTSFPKTAIFLRLMSLPSTHLERAACSSFITLPVIEMSITDALYQRCQRSGLQAK